MDISVRFFDDAGCEVCKRYFTSGFLGDVTAVGMVDVFVEKCTVLNFFPMKFCLHRWVENARVAARALLMIAPLKKYIDTITKHPKKYTVPDSERHHHQASKEVHRVW